MYRLVVTDQHFWCHLLLILTVMIDSVQSLSHQLLKLTDADIYATVPVASCVKLGHPTQRRFCLDYSLSLMPHVLLGLRSSLDECGRQFSGSRWNCSKSAVAGGLRRTTRETAFVTALASAGVARAIARACGMGNATLCSCAQTGPAPPRPSTSAAGGHGDLDSSVPSPENPDGHSYYWSGCSDNAQAGDRFAAMLMDSAAAAAQHDWRLLNSPDKDPRKYGRTKTAAGANQTTGVWGEGGRGKRRQRGRRLRRRQLQILCQLHNSKAGRLTVVSGVATRCRCHGTSGSCSLRSCWRSVPSLAEVATVLRRRYESAVRVSGWKRDTAAAGVAGGGGPVRLIHGRDNDEGVRGRPADVGDLVFRQSSPTYCDRNIRKGSLGTSGRECSVDSHSGGNWCNSLCCNRGFKSERVTVSHRCHCKFHWCCEVKCKICETDVLVHRCL